VTVRIFWLKSDKKTVQEVADHKMSLKLWKRSHVVYVHSNGEFYTNRSSIRARQFRQIVAFCSKELGVAKK
jgi:hypothetical protein